MTATIANVEGRNLSRSIVARRACLMRSDAGARNVKEAGADRLVKLRWNRCDGQDVNAAGGVGAWLRPAGVRVMVREAAQSRPKGETRIDILRVGQTTFDTSGGDKRLEHGVEAGLDSDCLESS